MSKTKLSFRTMNCPSHDSLTIKIDRDVETVVAHEEYQNILRELDAFKRDCPPSCRTLEIAFEPDTDWQSDYSGVLNVTVTKSLDGESSPTTHTFRVAVEKDSTQSALHPWISEELLPGLSQLSGNSRDILALKASLVSFGSPYQQLLAIEDLNDETHPDVADELVRLFRSSEDIQVLNTCATFLGDRQATQAIPLLVDYIDSPKNWGKCGSMIFALSQYDTLDQELLLKAVKWVAEGELESQLSALVIVEKLSKTADVTTCDRSMRYLQDFLDSEIGQATLTGNRGSNIKDASDYLNVALMKHSGIE